MQIISHILGVTRDIPAPDMGTNARTMAWMMDAYGSANGYTPGIVTGKPVELGGSYGREAATGRGVVIVLDELCRERGMRPGEVSVVVQGFGNVGSWAARIAYDAGYRVVGAGDLRGAVHNPSGIDVPALGDWLAGGAPADDCRIGTVVTADDLLALECDVLIPAATGEVIARMHAATSNVVELAVESARAAQAEWARVRPVERGRVLRRAADLLRARNEEIARLETWRRAGTSYLGTLRYDGRTWRVRCSEEC